MSGELPVEIVEGSRSVSDHGPAPYPCSSCPYRLDVPSGVWEAVEYEKLPAYDRPTGEQPLAVFYCHQQNGRLCSGWVGCHDMHHSLGLRIAVSTGRLTVEDMDAALTYVSPVPLHSSGMAAAQHGLRDVQDPSPAALRAMGKLRRRAHRRSREASSGKRPEGQDAREQAREADGRPA